MLDRSAGGDKDFLVYLSIDLLLTADSYPPPFLYEYRPVFGDNDYLFASNYFSYSLSVPLPTYTKFSCIMGIVICLLDFLL